MAESEAWTRRKAWMEGRRRLSQWVSDEAQANLESVSEHTGRTQTMILESLLLGLTDMTAEKAVQWLIAARAKTKQGGKIVGGGPRRRRA